MQLPKPECKMGYTQHQLKQILGDRLEEFNNWMTGQTIALCNGRVYDHDEREYKPDNCGPHGWITYAHDLRRYLGRVTCNDPHCDGVMGCDHRGAK